VKRQYAILEQLCVYNTAKHDFNGEVFDREGFWLEAADAIDWDVAPTVAVDASDAPLYRWIPDGLLNTCFNALDRRVIAGRGVAAPATTVPYEGKPAGTPDAGAFWRVVVPRARFSRRHRRRARSRRARAGRIPTRPDSPQNSPRWCATRSGRSRHSGTWSW
jgi:hypothetical protein